jgi:hypothetical protein
MQIFLRSVACCVPLLACVLAGCQRGAPSLAEYPMGEKVPIGHLTYTVVDSAWPNQFGDIAEGLRTPQQRFLSITLSVTNGGGADASVPLFTLEGSDGQSYLELQDGRGVDNWFGLLRTLAPGQTQQGRIIFDVPLATYRLRLTDGAGPGAERFTWVTIPLSLDVDAGVPTPGLGLPGGK